jgi:hypothetical protein
MIAMIPKLESFINAHFEIAEGYMKYRNNGGVAISGIEKHVGIKKLKKTLAVTSIKSAAIKMPKDSALTFNSKKKIPA